MMPGGLRFSIGRTGGAALLTLALASAPALARNPLKLPNTQYEPVNWSQVEGWAEDDHDEAFVAFLQSCKAILAGSATRDGQPMYGALHKVCQKAVELKPEKPGEARLFFEQNFKPVRIAPLGNPDGFVTGYYEPIVLGQRERGDGYDTPLYRKPPNLSGGRMVVVSAAASEGDGAKKKKKRKLARRSLQFYDRTSIENGVLAGRNLEICWLKDPVDSFFAQIQGSVRVQLEDGNLMRLNYAAANGHPYYAIGRDLIERNIIPKDEMSMDRIRQWLVRNRDEGRDLMRKNKSYVFFRETRLSSNDEPLGAQGISLTPGRSIAVDRKLHTYGTPFFISAQLPINGLKPDTWFRRLMVAQDTGGAIVGPARADIYFGAGDEAEEIAGRLRHEARFVMLLPRSLDPTKSPEDDEIPLPRPKPEMSEALVAVAPAEATPAMTASIVSDAKSADAVINVLPLPKPAEKKPDAAAEKKVAAKSADPAPEKKTDSKTSSKVQPKTASKTEAKTEPRTEAKADKTPDKKKTKVAEKSSSSRSDWEARVMPVIPPDEPAKKSNPKKKK